MSDRHSRLSPMISAGALAALVWAGPIAWSNHFGRVSVPFVHFDIAVVHALCTLPFAQLLAAILERRIAMTSFAAIGFVVLTGLCLGLASPQASDVLRRLQHDAFDEAALRTGIALAVTLSVSLLILSLLGRKGRRGVARPVETPSNADGTKHISDSQSPSVASDQFRATPPALPLLRGGIGTWLFATICASLVPAAYTQSWVDRLTARLERSITEFRPAKALQIANELAVLAPRTRIRRFDQSHDLATTTRDAAAVIENLESEVAQPLAADATDKQRIDFGGRLAALGRVAEARAILKPLGIRTRPESAACSLLGTLDEDEERWQSAYDWYLRAETACDTAGPSSENTAERFRALKGRGYSGRKLGRNTDAEAAYVAALELSSTADVHYLLAQFYEDTQQARLAHQHAREAIRLDPKNYRASGERLIDKLITNHFGCLPVFTRDRASRDFGLPLAGDQSR